VSAWSWHKLGCSREETDLVLEACRGAAADGVLAGIDLLSEPYDAAADWALAERVAAAASDAGLGLTAHAGEFTTSNLEAALELRGLTRIGHATQAARDRRLLERLAERDITVECCLSSNVALGAVRSLDEHPLPAFLAAGIPVALGTDDPVELGTTIDQEYALAASLGLGEHQLLDLTRAAITASFAPPARRAMLLEDVTRVVSRACH